MVNFAEHSNPRRRAPTVALVAIVKNELPIIERMFKSVEDICDTWVVVDTGSTDGTYEWLEEYHLKHPGLLSQDYWRDFGSNRTVVMSRARGVAEYLLLLDADMTVERVTEPQRLTEDVYLLEHVGDAANYWVERLVKGNVEWSYGGRTHEYLQRNDGQELEGTMLRSLRVRHHGDGSSRIVKYHRDLQLLLTDWDDPDSNKVRTACYLASTYALLGDQEKQVEWLRKHIEIGDPTKEDVYASQFHLAQVTNDPVAMFQAWMMRPSRAEPLAFLAQRFCLDGDFHHAYYVARAALGIPYPEDEISHISPAAYDYDLLFQFSVAAFNIGRSQEAVEAGRALLGRNLPDNIRKQAETNLAQFLQEAGNSV